MANQIVTPNLQLALPGDDSHNTPWGQSDQVLAAAIAQVDTQLGSAAVDTGTANAYAVALSPAPALALFARLVFKAVHANTGASTLAINGGSTHPITKNGTTALAGAEISANQIVQVIFDGTNWQLISQ